MDRKLAGRAIAIVVVILLCVFGIIGFPKSLAELKANVANNIKLGLDLKGGSHLILQVQVQDAMKVEADQTIERMRDELRKQGVEFSAIDRNDPTTIDQADSIQINIRGVAADKSADLRRVISERFPNWVLTPVSSTDYRMNLRPTELLTLKRDTVERSMRTIEQRINGLGLTEPVIQMHGRTDAEYEILVQLPGVDDPARVKNIMQTAAMLEITNVVGGPYASAEQAMAANGGVLPLNTKLARMAAGRDAERSFFLVGRSAVITGRDLRNARPGRDEFQRWETDFTLTQDGARRFGRFTEQNIGKQLAVLLDNQIHSVATIQNRIDDSGRITGIGGEQEASDLALVLRAGSLPAGIVYLEERTIGPSLGADSIQQGLVAGVVGLVAVVSFMLVYYKKSGVNATLALILNAVVLLAALAYFGAVLTLPGIAGIILSVGMAVDANVIIFERFKEEVRRGRTVKGAVKTGFKNAMSAIIDGNVTTLIAALVLLAFGTGSIQGFARTLFLSVATSMISALLVTRFLLTRMAILVGNKPALFTSVKTPVKEEQ